MVDKRLPNSHAEAVAAGALHYFTGLPCKRGHVAPRLRSSCVCTACGRVSAQAWRRAHPDKARKLAREWALLNWEHVRVYQRHYRAANAERLRSSLKAWRERRKAQAAERE